jgi:hypothetical protein
VRRSGAVCRRGRGLFKSIRMIKFAAFRAKRVQCDENSSFIAKQHMHEEWLREISGERLVKFTYIELPDGEVFMTAQIAGHEVVYSVLRQQTEPFSREAVERHFGHELRPISN